MNVNLCESVTKSKIMDNDATIKSMFKNIFGENVVTG